MLQTIFGLATGKPGTLLLIIRKTGNRVVIWKQTESSIWQAYWGRSPFSSSAPERPESQPLLTGSYPTRGKDKVHHIITCFDG
jgi:hypothetical protein